MAEAKTNTLSSPVLLEKIDKLRERNIGQHVPLPQLVVVGDQSSGKSSLLESLTGIPFPRNVELCTRHATQITSRRDSQSRVEIRIIPGPNATEEHKKDVESYYETVDSNKDLRSRFTDILNKASETMGIRTSKSSKLGSVFSEDILKIEICGPTEDYLTVIDVPGIFRTPAEGITTKDDVTLVSNLVKRYIQNKRTIILAVLPCNVDIATQEIIALARQYDKNQERTLGVLTKPDLVQESAAKASVCSLVAGKRMPLTLGYYLVRNRGADDEDEVKHETLDSMFREEPWVTLPRERVGIHALKKELEALLAQITRREFPSLRREIQSQATDCQKELDGIGPARPNEREQRRFLSDIARQFEYLARRAIDGQFSQDRLFQDPSTRLITRLINLTDVFNASFLEYGQHRQFADINRAADSSGGDSGGDETEEPTSDSSDEDSRLFDFHGYLIKSLDEAGSTDFDQYPDLSNTISQWTFIRRPQGEIMEWIKKLYVQSRGMDMGTFSPDLLSAAFREQSRQWDDMVKGYMSEVVRLIHHFVTKALQSICPDDTVMKEIWTEILSSLLERYQSGLDQASLLVEIERSYRPYTLNRSFNEEVQGARGQRAKAMLEPKARQVHFDGRNQKMVYLTDVNKSTTAKANEEHLEEEIHDKLRAYYHLAANRVMDNVFRQAICHQLLKGPANPLTVFSQSWVIDLDAAKLELIAGETEAVKKRREILSQKQEDLQVALDILRA